MPEQAEFWQIREKVIVKTTRRFRFRYLIVNNLNVLKLNQDYLNSDIITVNIIITVTIVNYLFNTT